MRQPLFLQSATHDIVRGCVKTSQTAFGGQLPYQGSRGTPLRTANCGLRDANCGTPSGRPLHGVPYMASPT